jgi:hypothetical protein
LAPSIEVFAVNKPREVIGDLYGYIKSNQVTLTHVFTSITPKGTSSAIQGLKRDKIVHIAKNLESLIGDPKIHRVGDYHTHPFRSTECPYPHRSHKRFYEAFGERTDYSNCDLESMMLYPTDIYLIVGVGPQKRFKNYPRPAKFTYSLAGQTKDNIYVISGWYFDTKLKEFARAKIKM